MRRGYVSLGVLAVSLSLLLVSCAARDPQGDFASFDKVYIPALALTNQGEIEESTAAMIPLKEGWKALKNKYYGYNSEDPGWKQDFDNVEQMILKADEIVISGGNLLDAHELLEGVRFAFMELRKRNGMDYYIDYLTEFHEPMEEIALTAKGKTADTLTDADVSKIQDLLNESLRLLERIETAEFDGSLFGFSDKETEIMRDYIRLESESLSRLKQSIEAGDRKSIIQSSIGIKPNFVKLFLLFGDFPEPSGS